MVKNLKIALPLILIVAFALGTHAQEHFKRGLEQISFVPKGQWIGGVSVSYSQSDFENYQFLIVENLNGDTYTFKVSPMVMFCFKDNLAAGGRLSYSRSRTRLDGASLVLGADTSYDVDNLYSISHNYHGTAMFRNYISLGKSMRFGFFNEVDLSLGGGQSKLVNGTGDELTGTYERNFNLNIGLTPGIIMFLSNYSAIEVSIGVLGFNYTHTHSISDQIYQAERNRKSANFRINLFSVQFGVAFYI
jgi:hypothetical protein